MEKAAAKKAGESKMKDTKNEATRKGRKYEAKLNKLRKDQHGKEKRSRSPFYDMHECNT